MRNNQPVINEEYVIPEGVTLVSKTDLVGNITECNEAFQIVSGYTQEELIGKPHNLVRHPDIPEAVFADLWQCLKDGNTWSQVVKNRCADGKYYWVRANATPIFTDSKITGFMSVRTPVTEAEKTATAQAYLDIKSGKAKIKDARVYYGFDWQKLNFFPRLSTTIQFPIISTLFLMLPYLVYAASADHSLLVQTAITALLLLLPATYGYLLNKENRKSEEIMLRVASGEHLSNIWFNPRTNLGRRQTAIRAVYLASREKIEDAAYKLDKANQLQTAIDQLSSSIMIADSKLRIEYLNNGMKNFLKEKEDLFKSEIPDIDLNNIIGQNIDMFHNKGQYSKMLEGLTEIFTGKITIADTHIEVTMIPVFNHLGQRTATIAEWQDKSAEAQLLKEVGSAVNAAEAGMLNSRIDLSRVDGVAKELSTSINSLISAVEAPVNEAVQVAVALSEGRLTRQVEGEYLGRFSVMQESLNVAVDNLNSMMAQTKSATQSVNNGADQIFQGSISLNDRTQSQAASLEETAASMEEMTATVKQNAESSQEASRVTKKTAAQAQSGVEVMYEAIQSMEQINESSQKINDIIGLIDSIAFQTNLLALNAAVEAARAGEHGRGFAVVAGEVRNLAGKSSEAAKDIRGLIEDTVNKVTEGSNHVKGSGDALNEIVESISNVNQIIEEIAASSKEQSEGVSQVNQAITNIDTAVQQNAALVEETAATAEELGEMSKTMSRNIAQFVINESSTTSLIDQNGFDFESARRGHKQWRVKARAYINDVDIDFNANTASDPSACALGTWVYGDGQTYSASPAFQRLELEHSEFHALLGQIINFKNIGDIESANEHMEKFAAQSLIVIEHITQLEREISGFGDISVPKAGSVKPVKAVSKPASPRQTPTAKPAAGAVEKNSVQQPAPAQPTDNGEEWSDF